MMMSRVEAHGTPLVPLALPLSPPGLLVHILPPRQAQALRHSCDSELQEPGTQVWAMTAPQGRPKRMWRADHGRSVIRVFPHWSHWATIISLNPLGLKR